MPASKFTRFPELNRLIAFDALEGIDIDSGLQYTNGLAKSTRRGDTHVVGSFTCPKASCGKTWASGRVYTEIFFKPPTGDARDHAFDVVVWKQQCRKCRSITNPELDEATYKERIASKLQLFIGARAPILPEKDDKETPPHRKELCCACKAGKCEQMKRGRRA